VKQTETKIPTELGNAPVGRLLKQYAFPAIIAQTAASLYNMVDAIFIGQGVGPMAISGLAITFPFMNMAAAFGTLVGVGGSTICSMLLGQKDYVMARRTLGNVVVLNSIIGLLFTLVSLAFLNPILRFFGASDSTLPYAREYMVIILAANVITHIYFGLNAVLRSSGHPKEAMAATIFTVILNAILDPIFIFGMKTGIKGAAIATVISQAVSLMWIVYLLSRRSEVVHFEKNVFRLHRRLVKDSFAIGMAPFLMNFTACFVIILVNNTLGTYGGDLSIGAFGVANRISFVFVMVCLGLTQGMQPIVGYNFGARQMDRAFEAMWKTLKWGLVVMVAGCLAGWLVPGLICRLFTNDSDLLDKSKEALRIIMSIYPAVAVGIVIGNFFQSIGKAWKAIFLSLSRQILFLIPVMLFLAPRVGVMGVWLSFPVSDVISAVMALILLRQLMVSFRTDPESIFSSGDDFLKQYVLRAAGIYRRLAFFKNRR